jgi:hypothetical protein
MKEKSKQHSPIIEEEYHSRTIENSQEPSPVSDIHGYHPQQYVPHRIEQVENHIGRNSLITAHYLHR